MAAELRRAHIHHKDGNPLNNDPGNWQVLCAKCHAQTFSREKKNEQGFSVHVRFKPWLREKILKAAGYRCQECFYLVGDANHKRCSWCGGVAAEADRVEWPDKRIMCRECLDEWTELGRPAEYSPLAHARE